MNIDEWFKRIREKYASQMQCGKGCTATFIASVIAEHEFWSRVT